MRSLEQFLVRLLVWLSSPGCERGPHITRFVMYRRIRELAVVAPSSARTLSISHSGALLNLFGLANTEIVEANYPETNVLALPFDDGEFDFVVSDQVFEHIEGNPFLAMEETLRVLKPGGMAVHTTCFINPIHAAPADFWRYTPGALKLLVGDRAHVVESSGWGNPLAWLFIMCGFRYVPVPHMRFHPLYLAATWNLTAWPIVTWVVAQRRYGVSSAS